MTEIVKTSNNFTQISQISQTFQSSKYFTHTTLRKFSIRLAKSWLSFLLQIGKLRFSHILFNCIKRKNNKISKHFTLITINKYQVEMAIFWLSYLLYVILFRFHELVKHFNFHSIYTYHIEKVPHKIGNILAFLFATIWKAKI